MNLTLEREEFMIVRHERKPLCHSIECTIAVTKVSAQLAELQIDPRIVRLLTCTLLGIA